MMSRDTLRYTTFAGFAVLVLGLQISQRGPAFIDLIEISGTDLEGGSVYITSANLCYMVGSFISGYLFNRVKISSMTVSVGMFLSGLCIVVTPWCSHFVPMLLVFSMTSVFGGLYETTINSEQIRICKGNSESAMQFLSFSYSLGGIFGPLITEPFLSSKDAASATYQHDPSNATLLPSYMDNVSYVIASNTFNASMDAVSINESSTVDPSISTGRPFTNYSTEVKMENQIHYAFLITAILSVMAAIPFLVLCYISWGKEHPKRESSEFEPSSRKLPKKVYIGSVGIACLYYFLFTAVDDSFAQYLTYFVVNHLDWSKENGALVTAVYWGFSTFIKLILFLLASRVKTGIVLFLSNIGMVVSYIGFSIASQLHIHTLVWVFTAFIALSVSGIFGGGLAWLDSNLVQMDGKATAAIIISAAFGCTVVPIPTGVLMSDWSPMALPYILLGLSCLDLLVVIILLFFLKPLIQRKYGPPRPSLALEILPDNEAPDSTDVAINKCADSNGTKPVMKRDTEEATQFI